MREIKFRAWVKSTKDMVMPDRLTGLEASFMSERDEDVIMQYTGLKDKNGKEIYEGDVVKYWLPTLKRWEIGDVRWDDVFASWSMFGNWHDNDWVKIESKEVIGNIYENPELINKE